MKRSLKILTMVVIIFFVLVVCSESFATPTSTVIPTSTPTQEPRSFKSVYDLVQACPDLEGAKVDVPGHILLYAVTLCEEGACPLILQWETKHGKHSVKIFVKIQTPGKLTYNTMSPLPRNYSVDDLLILDDDGELVHYYDVVRVFGVAQYKDDTCGIHVEKIEKIW